MSKGRFGLVGERLSHSVSPMVHQYLGDYSYELIERNEEQVRNLFSNGEYDGFNVTIPYKVLAYNLCDDLSEEAKAIGSVNTVVFLSQDNLSPRKSIGYNTDAFGFEYLLAQYKIEIEGKSCLILGTGGAARSVKYVLGLHNAKTIDFCTRNSENFDIAGAELSNVIEYDELYNRVKNHGPVSDYDVIINTTPVGMYSNNVPDPEYLKKSPIDLESFEGLEAVVDIIYNPPKTCLCEQAESLGIKWAGGIKMLIAQAYKSSMLFKNV